MLIPFRFSYHLDKNWELLVILRECSTVNHHPKAGKKIMSRLLTSYFFVGSPWLTGLLLWKVQKACFAKDGITAYRNFAFGIETKFFFPLRGDDRRRRSFKVSPGAFNFCLGCTRSGKGFPTVWGKDRLLRLQRDFSVFIHTRRSVEQRHCFLMTIWQYPARYEWILPFVLPVALVHRNCHLSINSKDKHPIVNDQPIKLKVWP